MGLRMRSSISRASKKRGAELADGGVDDTASPELDKIFQKHRVFPSSLPSLWAHKLPDCNHSD